jgi:hypothetical protein
LFAIKLKEQNGIVASGDKVYRGVLWRVFFFLGEKGRDLDTKPALRPGCGWNFGIKPQTSLSHELF